MEAGKNNSIRPSAFVCDEMGNMKDRSNFDAMKSGQKSVLNPLIFRTTTAYAINNSIMIAELEYARKVLKGKTEQPDLNQFALIYYAEEEHLWDDTGLYQANPLRVESNYEAIRKNRTKALEQDELVSEYLTKEMNVFQAETVGHVYIEEEDFKKCKMTQEELDSFSWYGRQVYLAMDMSLTSDNTAVAMVTRDERTGHYYAKVVAFIPTGSIDIKSRKEHVDYHAMVRDGYAIAGGTGDEEKLIDYKKVVEYVTNVEYEYGVIVKRIGFDQMNALHTVREISDYGYDLEAIRQFSTTLHYGTKELQEAVLGGYFHYIPNKLLEINVSNAVVVPDTNLNMYVAKNKCNGKVDMLVALINAMTMWTMEQLEEQIDYEERGIITLDL